MTSKPQFVGERVRLGDIANVTTGNVAPKASDFSEEGIPFVRAGSLSGLIKNGDYDMLDKVDEPTAKQLKLKLFPAGTVLFAKSGMSCLKGYVYTLERPCYVVSHLACVTPKGSMSTFLQHYFKYNKPNRLIENPSFPSIKLSKISEIEIAIPNEETLSAQTAVLNKINQQIAITQEQTSRLDTLVKSRFVEMFGDPIDESSPWPQHYIKDFCELRIGPFGSSLHKQDYITGGHALVNPSHMAGRKIVPDNDLTISDSKYDEMETYHLKPGDIVLGRRGEIGRCAVVCEEGYLCGTGSMIVRPSAQCRPDYLQRVLSFPSFKDALESKAVGQTMKNLNAKIVGTTIVSLPSLDAQQEFAAFVQQVDKLRFESGQDRCFQSPA